MFYYPAILNRQTGCFSTIWLVATKGKKVSKREYLKVNVPRTCDDLMDYILVRVAPPRAGLPKPRLSLYLSSLLQYGVIKVYHHQCEALFKDIREFLKRLNKYRVAANNDMTKPDGGDLCLPDVLSFLEDNEWAEDPLFGLMKGDVSFLSPSTLARMEGQFHSDWSSATSMDSLTALPETITMKETPPRVMPEFEGADLPDDDITDFLLAIPDDAFGLEEEAAAGTDPPRAEQQPEGERGREDSLDDLQRTRTTPTVPEAVPSPHASPSAPRPPRAGVSPPPAAEESPESSDDEDVPPPRRGKKRRRRPKVVVDRVMQIPERQLRQQIDDVFAHTAAPQMAGGIMADPEDLFTMPVNVLPAALMPLWERVAVIPSYADMRAMQRPESSSGYSSSDKAPSDEVPPQSDGDMSDGREQRASPSGRISTVGSPGRRLEDIPEEDLPEPGREAEPDMDMQPEGEEEEADRLAELMRAFEEQGETSVTLASLLGDELPSRRAMASAFMTLLVLVTDHTFNAEQDEPYNDIWISLRPASQE